jgi:hypothetical protein
MIYFFFQALWILAFFRRRKAIGGPLLVFFVQVLVQTALSLMDMLGVLVAWQKRDRSVPLPFDERTFHQALLILVLSFAATAVTAIAALALLKTRSWRYVAYVRGGLCALAALAIMSLLRHVSVGNWLNAIFPLLFLPYFFLSKRVRRAFHWPKLGEHERASYGA